MFLCYFLMIPSLKKKLIGNYPSTLHHVGFNLLQLIYIFHWLYFTWIAKFGANRLRISILNKSITRRKDIAVSMMTMKCFFLKKLQYTEITFLFFINVVSKLIFSINCCKLKRNYNKQMWWKSLLRDLCLSISTYT